MTTLALYEIAAEYRENLAAVMAADLDEQTLNDTLEAISGDIEVKAQNIAFVIGNMRATIGAMLVAEEAMEARRKAAEKRVKGIETYLKMHLEGCGIKKVECPHFTIAVQNNAEAVELFDEAQLPAEFMVTPPPVEPVAKPDKNAIKLALKAGRDVPGAKLVRGTRLSIK